MEYLRQFRGSLLLPSIACVFFALYVRSIYRWRSRARGRPLPPGPTRLPVVGSMFSVPNWKPWFGYRDLSTKYGDIVYLEVLGWPMVCLGSPKVMQEFLERRSANSSDRVKTPLIALAGNAFSFVFMPYGQWWRRHRRMFWQQFHSGKLPSYRPIQRSICRVFLAKLLRKPDQLVQLLKYNVTATTMKMTYGSDLTGEDDERIDIVETAFVGLRQVTISVQFLLQYFPFARHLPAWFPGAGFHKILERALGPSAWMLDVPFTEAKMNAERGETSIVADVLARMHNVEGTKAAEDDEEVARNIASIAVVGGSDTTISSLEGLFLALSLYPDVQKKAQAELDAVVGPRRLPDFDDWNELLYIRAIVKEALRWHNVVPLGVAHRTLEDDELNGYFIPAGTTVVPNVWACMHDPGIYPMPNEFRPERFIRDGKLDPDVLDPTSMIFGFGRRICPGRHFAEAAMFLTAACVLHVFDIGPPCDDSGKPIRINFEASHGFLSYPEDSRCTVKPRSLEAEALILNTAAN